MNDAELKAHLYTLPKEILIEKILPEMALAYKELPKIKAERDVYEMIARVDQYECTDSKCAEFCCISHEAYRLYFSFHDDVVYMDPFLKFPNEFGSFCWECETYYCPQHCATETAKEGDKNNRCVPCEEMYA